MCSGLRLRPTAIAKVTLPTTQVSSLRQPFLNKKTFLNPRNGETDTHLHVHTCTYIVPVAYLETHTTQLQPTMAVETVISQDCAGTCRIGQDGHDSA